MNDSTRSRHVRALGLIDEALPEEARRAFLREVRQHGFAPPEMLLTGVNTIAGTTLPLTREAMADEQTHLDAAVAAFEEAYWSLEPAERRAQWEQLSSVCQNSRFRTRLRQLEPGLDVPVKSLDDRLAGEIATFIRYLFLLPDREHAVRRARWLVDHRDRYAELSAAGGRLRASDDPVTRLDPLLIDWLVRGDYPKPLAATTTSQDRKAWYWVIGSVLAVVLIAIGAARQNRTHQEAGVPPFPRWPAPAPVFTNDEIFVFESYERRRALGDHPSKPTRYDLWVSAGRPGRRVPESPKPGSSRGESVP